MIATCLNTNMAIQDIWFSNLKTLIKAEGGGRRGIRAVADASGLSEEYIYQLAEKKPNSKGVPREIGKDAARKIAIAFALGRDESWFDANTQSGGIAPLYTGGANQPLAPVEPAQAATKTIATLAQITEALAGYLMHMDDDGRDDAADILRKLAHKPENHARAATMLTAAFHAPKRKSA